MPPNVPVKLLIVDDHPLFRQGVRWALSTFEEITIVGEASNGEEALEWLENALPSQEPNVILVDWNLPGMSGIELTRQLRHQYTGVGVVMLSIYQSEEYVFKALEAGAAGYRSKDIAPKDLVDVLQRVARGEYEINDMVWREPKIATRLLSQFRSLPQDVTTVPEADFMLYNRLSDREIEVLDRIASGGSNKEIADELGISTQTVKNHISSILRKLSLNDRTQAVLYALRRGWIEAPEKLRGTGEIPRVDNDE